MSQYILQGEDITAVEQVVDGKGMTAEMGMQPGDTGLFRQSGEEQLESINGDWFTVFGDEQAITIGTSASRPADLVKVIPCRRQ